MARCRRAVAALVCSLSVVSLSAQVRTPESVAAWREDLAYLERQLPKTHANLFHTIQAPALASMFEKLRADVPRLNDNRIAVELMRIVAAIGDGHSTVEIHNPNLGFTLLPVMLYPFSDGLFVRAAAAPYRDIVGKHVTRIGSVSVDEAIRKVSELIPRDNEMTVRSSLPLALAFAKVLNGLGLTPSDTEATITVDDRGTPRTITVRAIGLADFDKSEWIDARPGPPAQAPLYLEDAILRLRNPWTRFYWFKHLPERKALYIKYNAVANADDESVAAFFDRTYTFADQNGVEKLVVDLRNNGGGNNYLNLPVVHGIIKRDAFNQRGSLFVIIGRETFSAAQNMANLFEKHTNAIFVGEPTGGRPNHFGDSARITMPNSKWAVRVSTLWWQDMDPRDKRPWIAPEVAVEVSSSDYIGNRDPVVDTIFALSDTRRLTERLEAALKSGGEEAAGGAFQAFRADPRHKYANVEREVNSYGYRLIGEKRIDDAIAILKLNAAAFPESWNVHDSLAEAYALKGERERAIASYERAAALNPARAAIRDAIEELKKRQ